MATLRDFGFCRFTADRNPLNGNRPLLIVFVDVNGTPFSRSLQDYQNLIFPDNGMTVNAFFSEMSHGRFKFSNGGMVGPIQLSAPDLELPLNQRVGRILEIASSQLHFEDFDRNNDDALAPEELAILIIDNTDLGATAIPAARPFPIVGRRGLTYGSTVAIVDHNSSLDVIVHELLHVLGAIDLAFGPNKNGNARTTIMAKRGGMTHLDPWHRMAFGWVTPQLHDLQTGAHLFSLGLVASDRIKDCVLLYDSTRDLKEFFMLEFRSKDARGVTEMDDWIISNGLAIWHIVPDGTHDLPKVISLGRSQLSMGGNLFWNSLTETPYLTWLDGFSLFAKLAVHQFYSYYQRIDVELIIAKFEVPPQERPYVRWIIEGVLGVNIYGHLIVKPPKPQWQTELLLSLQELESVEAEGSRFEIQKTALARTIFDLQQYFDNFDPAG